LLENQAPQPEAARHAWQNFLEEVRSFFVRRGFRNWSTPFLVTSSGVDAHIDFMTVQGVRTGRAFALPTSPEFELKKALSAGEEKIFEIKSCFRDDEASPIHRPEFTMLEWYRAYEDKWSLVDDFDALVAHLAPAFPGVTALPTERVSMAELFQKHVGFSLTPATSREDLQRVLRSRGLHLAPVDDWDDLFFRLYIEYIEPRLGHDRPTAVYDFPASQSSLARRTEQGWADRFEIYWRGVELANAYQEQNNPYLVIDTVKREIGKRQGLNRIPPQIDKSFINAMQAGFPPATGAAMGLDRLFMVLRGAPKLL
jgi:lysyl-tRNA synthetase class 2